jgi:hypothetical protein
MVAIDASCPILCSRLAVAAGSNNGTIDPEFCPNGYSCLLQFSIAVPELPLSFVSLLGPGCRASPGSETRPAKGPYWHNAVLFRRCVQPDDVCFRHLAGIPRSDPCPFQGQSTAQADPRAG